MKIGLVTPYEYPYPGGVTEHVYHLDRCFRSWGHDVKIIAPCDEDEVGLQDNVVRVGGSIVTLPFAGSRSRITLSPSIYRSVKKLLKQEQFDVIHLHEPLMPALPLVVLRHSHAVNVGTFHAYRENRHPFMGPMQPVLRKFVNRLDVKICVSEAARDLVDRYFPGDYQIIPNGIDAQFFGAPNIEPIERFRDGRPNILFVGRMDKRKGLRYLLEAFALVIQAIPDARLIVVGPYSRDDKEPFVRYAYEHHLSGVKFVGRVSPEELPRYYKTCDLFCAPSTGFESFGIVLLEAMAACRPIVATNIAGYRGVLEDGREGLLVEPENERALAEAIIRVLRDSSLRATMGEQGRLKAEQYDWPIVARRVLGIYVQALSHPGSRSRA
jgi:phosphatidylinositol alpha-mannosyltransferase